MNTLKKYIHFFIAAVMISMVSCKDDATDPVPVVDDTFAKGADVGWITEMEASGINFYNEGGVSVDGIKLLKSLGMNSIRLRVWVNPANGWNNKQDVLVKAIRATNLGMKLLVDFHYSDTWADPGQQTKPVAWAGLSLDGLKSALADHTKEVLQLLKDHGISPEWVQVGNETSNGMLWDEGKASSHMANYAALNNAGYDAVKSVFPDSKVIVHLNNGYDNAMYRWLFDGLQANGAKWDVIGMSLYPTKDNWEDLTDRCFANIADMVSRYGSEIMICEVGMSWDEEDAAEAWLTSLMKRAKEFEGNKVLGVFYWEPLAYAGWNGYTLGAFNDEGKPTKAWNAFK